MIDLATIRSIKQAELPVTHPVTGKATGAFVTLASPDHPARKQAIAAATRRLRESGEAQEPELLAALTVEAVAASALGWRGFKVDGKELAYSPAAALDLLSKPELKWLREQLAAGLGRQENFIETSANG